MPNFQIVLQMRKIIFYHRSRTFYNLFSKRLIAQLEPPYLDANQSELPTYPPLNIQVKGYDFPILEKFTKWIHKISRHMDLEVEDCWATPSQKLHIKTYRPGTTHILSTYDLEVYERNIQVIDLEATVAPTFFEVIKAALPSGVELSIHEHSSEFYDVRFIPDYKLKELEKQLDDLGGPLRKPDLLSKK